jgi:tRNA(fMet)-specific endonuclease VapC
MNFLFDTNACISYLNNYLSPIRRKLEKLSSSQSTPIGPYDLQIAAIALAYDVTLVTHNTGEFSRVPHLRIEDWESEKEYSEF